MSHMSLIDTMKRIQGACIHSRILVFKSDRPGCLNSMFADTVYGRALLRTGHPKLIGVYDNTMDLHEVEHKLRANVCPELQASA